MAKEYSELDELFGKSKTDTQPSAEVQELNKAFARCFGTPAGRKVLAYLHQVRLAACFNAELGWENGIAYGFAREGQNTLINEIDMRIDAGQKE
jgi:hypothetical protein